MVKNDLDRGDGNSWRGVIDDVMGLLFLAFPARAARSGLTYLGSLHRSPTGSIITSGRPGIRFVVQMTMIAVCASLFTLPTVLQRWPTVYAADAQT
jgi:hypothetical protein